MNRRKALAVLSGLAVGGLTGCSDPGSPLRIAVVWSGEELKRFRRFVRDYHQEVVVYSGGEDIAALLQNPAGPDVAIIPQPWLLDNPKISRRIQPVLQPVAPTGADEWQKLVLAAPGTSASGTAADGNATGPAVQVKGVWFKVTHKSLIWRGPNAPPFSAGPGDGDPASGCGEGALPSGCEGGWEGWLEHCRRLARDGTPPLSIAAADGWTLTDWFENVLLGISRETYAGLLNNVAGAWNDENVEKALTSLATLWSIPGLVPGGFPRALTTQFHDSILDVFYYRNADMLSAPDFAWPVIKRYHRPPGNPPAPKPIRFPWPCGKPQPPVLVGGDVAVALGPGRASAVDFVKWITDPRGGVEGLKDWAREGGFLSPELSPDVYPDELRDLAREVRTPPAPSVPPGAFDLSDKLTGGLAGGDGKGLWRILTKLFIEVADDGARGSGCGKPVAGPVARALEHLRKSAG
ncbi:hypothetical protein [Streptosporangium sp. NPDC051022]|uniref:hypothetical protein n=1 Tax=Streptosporangium sp. NPDC051022 TaxID=3155752 RepID=UPI00341F76DC